MSKNIILCSDGTGNSAIKGRGTNVFKLFEAVDLHAHRSNAALDAQLAFYDDGVGTSGNLLLKVAGGAAGYGLKRNVKSLYRQLSRVYDEGDRIFLFGFSRGAFTVRTLAGLIGACGVLRGEEFATARQLHQAVEETYDAYRARYDSLLTRAAGRLLRWPDRCAAVDALQRQYAFRTGVRIAFIGVWDTVDAVGLPFALAGFVNRVLYQFKFPTQELGGHVDRACHALSIDDDRRAFEPVLWRGPDPRLEQVWFSGAHSNVGGGYPKQGLSLLALDWMLTHAADRGLRLQKADCELFRGHASVDDTLYDPRTGLGLFYRWAPRDVRAYCERNGIAPPRIHLTVAERIAHATDDYAPGNIPPDAVIVTTSVDRDERDRAAKERTLRHRAETVQAVMRDAFKHPARGTRYLLDEARRPLRFGAAAYWCFVTAWVCLVCSAASMTAGAFWHDAWWQVGWSGLAAAGSAFVLASALTAVADAGLSDTFSLFWQEHQKSLRAALKQAHDEGQQQDRQDQQQDQQDQREQRDQREQEVA
jgi:uncharacterized protein (DUF2235 family)